MVSIYQIHKLLFLLDSSLLWLLLELLCLWLPALSSSIAVHLTLLFYQILLFFRKVLTFRCALDAVLAPLILALILGIVDSASVLILFFIYGVFFNFLKLPSRLIVRIF